jgi:cation diffusion facilitator CzcD-associated flavoprotein CzcO
MLAAWLQQLGVKYLVVDKAARPGDAWRARYDSVKSHTASYGDHFPFLKYPSNWPNFLDRDPIANWIEHYCGIMGLNILQNAAVTTIDRDDETGKYSVNVAVQGSQRIFKAHHVVLATGITSNTPNLPDIKQQDTFKGLVYHTSKHKSASKIPDLGNKRVVVIGAASSGHDVAQDFVNHGAKSVSMIQRSRLAVTSTDSIEKFQAKPWGIPGVGTDDADLLTASMSGAIALTLGVGMAQMMSHNDKELLDGLEEAGMALVRGEDGVGILDFQLLKFGHFYIDQGASPMIVDGRIKVFRCAEGVKEFYDDGIILANDTRVEADVVVFATGFKGIDATLEPLLGKEIATAALSWTKTNKETELNGVSNLTCCYGEYDCGTC